VCSNSDAKAVLSLERIENGVPARITAEEAEEKSETEPPQKLFRANSSGGFLFSVDH
jgi:hypothetical protein